MCLNLCVSRYCLVQTHINGKFLLALSSTYASFSVRIPVQVIKSLQYETGKVPVDYEENFRRADHTFLYQVVFDPRTQQQVRLNEVPSDIDLASFEFAGTYPSPHSVLQCPFIHYCIPRYPFTCTAVGVLLTLDLS